MCKVTTKPRENKTQRHFFHKINIIIHFSTPPTTKKRNPQLLGLRFILSFKVN